MHYFTRQPHTLTHFLSGFDARVKLLAALAVLILVISHRGVAFPLVVAGLCLTLCLALGVRPKVLALRFAEPLFIALMVIFLKCFFSGAEPLFFIKLAGLEIVGHWGGLLEGLRIAARICGAVSVVAAVGFATPFTELMVALAWFRVPQGFTEIALFTWRYLFVLLDDAQVVYSAQKNRLGYVGYRRGLRSFGTLAGTLVIKAFDNSQNITVAMAQRGYDGAMPLMRYKPLRLGEVLASLLVIAVMGVMWRGF